MSNLITNSPRFVSTLLHRSKMPAFTLYGARGSSNTDRVRLTLAEGGFTDYEFVVVNLQKGEQKVGEAFLSGRRRGVSSLHLNKLSLTPLHSSPKKT